MQEEKIKQVFNLESSKSFSAAEGNENERRCNDAKIDRLNLKETNHYDKTRRHLNFEIGPDRKVHPLGYQKPLHTRLYERLDQLGFKPFKEGAKNAPNIAARIIFGGNHDRTVEMAFGKQEINFEKGANNSHVERRKEIEDWALDVYDWCASRFGAENVIGLQVHLDETSPHAHALIVPVGRTKKRGKTKVMWSAYFGEHKTGYGTIMEEFHTDLYNKVNCKYGLERGDSVKGRNVKHLSKDELTEYNKLKEQHKKAIKGLQKMRENLMAEISEKQKSLADLQQQLDNGKISVSEYEEKKRVLSQELSECQTKLDDKSAKLARKEQELESTTKILQSAKSTYVFKSIKSDLTPPQITDNPPLFGVDSWKEKQNQQIARSFNAALTKMENHCISQLNQAVNAVKKEIVVDHSRLGQLESERSHLVNENQELAIELVNSLAIMANDNARNLVLHVATLLFNGQPVPPIGGGGGSDSSLPWDGRKRDEDEETYRLRCLFAAMQHVSKTMPKKGRKR